MRVTIPLTEMRGLTGIVCLGFGPLTGLAIQFDLAIAFGAIAFAVLVLTSVIIYIVRDLSEPRHLDLYSILIAAFWVSIAELILSFTDPSLLSRLGVYLPALAACPLVLSRTVTFVDEVEYREPFKEALAIGAGFWGLMAVTGLLREIFSAGTITLPFTGTGGVIVVPFLSLHPIAFVATGGAGMIFLGIILAIKAEIERNRGVKVT